VIVQVRLISDAQLRIAKLNHPNCHEMLQYANMTTTLLLCTNSCTQNPPAAKWHWLFSLRALTVSALALSHIHQYQLAQAACCCWRISDGMSGQWLCLAAGT
jgi:hypothetical protein